MKFQQFTRLGFVSLLAACAWGQSSPPVIAAGGILNAADYGTALAPGTMVSIFGTNLAPRTASASAIPLPTTLEGVSVEAVSGFSFNQLPLYFVSAGQINAQLPYSIMGTSLELRVRTAAGVSASRQIAITPRAPRLFTKTMDGKGEAILLHAANYRLVTDLEPATPGEYLILYLAGLGEVSPTVQPGRPGGDGGALGPLNRLTATVTATLGGANAPVQFAGLAPGFVGVYQLNIQAPANLPAGKPAVSVAVANVTSQGNIWISAGAPPANNPEDVLRRALEAQARGDITALLGECSSLNPANPASASRKVLEIVQRGVQFSNFRFTHLATAQGDKGTMSLVRAQVSYTATVRGVSEPFVVGLLALMKKEGTNWKVAALVPDDLLLLEDFENSLAPRAAERAPGADPLNIKSINQALTNAMKGGYLNEEKAALAAGFGFIGWYGGPIGDGTANFYQAVDMLSNGWEAIKEVSTNGFGPIGYAKAEQVAVGIFQIVSEPVPGQDAFADAVQANLEQYVFNLEMMRDLKQLKYQLLKAPPDGMRFSPRLHLLKPFQFNYPAGMDVTGDTTAEHAAGQPPKDIRFHAVTSINHRMPFRVLGEMPVDGASPVAKIALRLGGQLRGETYYIPVDITHLVNGEYGNGDIVLENFSQVSGRSGPRAVFWDASCRRGIHTLGVTLRNGERTPPISVGNNFMNWIRELRVTNLNNGDGFKLTAGSEISFQVLGADPSVDPAFWPNLTAFPSCFDMAITHPAIASLERGATSKVKGVAKGVTDLKLLLPASAEVEMFGEITRSVPIVVDEAQLMRRWEYVTVRVEVPFTTRDAVSGFVSTATPFVANNLFTFGYGDGTKLIVKRITWEGNTFRTNPARFVNDVRGYRGGSPWGMRYTGEISYTGTLDVTGRRLVGVTARIYKLVECCWYDPMNGPQYGPEFTSTRRETLTELEVGTLPLPDLRADTKGAFYRSADVASALRKYTFTEKEWRFGKLSSDVSITGRAAQTIVPTFNINFETTAPENVIP